MIFICLRERERSSISQKKLRKMTTEIPTRGKPRGAASIKFKKTSDTRRRAVTTEYL